MASAYYSTIFQEPAADIRQIVRDFNNYPIWIDGCGESLIEDGKSGNAVGAIRSVLVQRRHVRQRLLALSDTDPPRVTNFAVPPPLPVSGFRATLRISEVIDGNRAFVEWWANFECAPDRRDELTGTVPGAFAKWLESLRVALAGAGRESASSTAWRPSIHGSGPIRRLWP